jgi:hypothetical protein
VYQEKYILSDRIQNKIILYFVAENLLCMLIKIDDTSVNNSRNSLIGGHKTLAIISSSELCFFTLF